MRGLWFRIARLEHLMERRPELLSSVMLRQNPHAVHEWHKRVKLFEGNPTRQILTYTEAVKTVDAEKVCSTLLPAWHSPFSFFMFFFFVACFEQTAFLPFLRA